MTRKNGDNNSNQNGEGHQRTGMSSHPPDVSKAQVSNVEKLEKDLKPQHDAPVEQHRSSRRPRQRHQNPK